MSIANPRNRSFKSLAISKTLHCDSSVRWKVASDLRFRVAISEAETPSFSGISGKLAPSTWKSVAIVIVRFWCAKDKPPKNKDFLSLPNPWNTWKRREHAQKSKQNPRKCCKNLCGASRFCTGGGGAVGSRSKHNISRTHPSRDVIFFGQILAQKMPEIISVHDVWEPWKQALLASRDVIILVAWFSRRKFEWFVRIGLTRYKNRGFDCEWFARIDSRESSCESPVPLRW